MNKSLVIFRVIGNRKIGLGHIYRAITIADELKDNKIIFISELSNRRILNHLVPKKYKVLVFKKMDIVRKIIQKNPVLEIGRTHV